MKEVILTEKPNTAEKIANIIAKEYNLKKETIKHKKAKVIKLKGSNKNIYVLSAVGHLFGLHTRISTTYPVFEVEWKPLYDIDKSKKYVKDYIEAIHKYAVGGDEYIIATDFDIEGETIAYNIMKNIIKTNNAKRMKFSSLTQKEIIESYKKPLPSILLNKAMAGITRHTLDFFYGINLSRGLMSSLKKVNRFKILSIGRVQGPALAILVQKEKEIESFIPTKYYTIEGELINGLKIIHKNKKIENKTQAKKIFEKVKDEKTAHLRKLKVEEINVPPPPPYNLTDLQTDAFNIYKISPKKTQEIAQKLYEKALISYPRTSSQKLPPTINYKEILTNIASITKYQKFIKPIISKNNLKPVEGKKTDDAHPAIHPTGETNDLKTLSTEEIKIYDLIVRRFISVFYNEMIKQKHKGELEIKDEIFVFEFAQIKEQGWFNIYKDLVSVENQQYVLEKENAIKKIELKEKETQPPKRYTPAKLIKELEKRKLGTKATRAQIIETLYKRGYIEGKNTIKVTKLGRTIYEVINKYIPEILSERLTREMEEKLENIEKGKEKQGNTLNTAKKHIIEVCKKIKENEKEIGMEIIKTDEEDKKIGKCMFCGGNLKLITLKNKKRFIGCNNYPKCNNIIRIPQTGDIINKNKTCNLCNQTIITIKKGKKTYEHCINIECANNIYNKIKQQNNGVEGS